MLSAPQPTRTHWWFVAAAISRSCVALAPQFSLLIAASSFFSSSVLFEITSCACATRSVADARSEPRNFDILATTAQRGKDASGTTTRNPCDE